MIHLKEDFHLLVNKHSASVYKNYVAKGQWEMSLRLSPAYFRLEARRKDISHHRLDYELLKNRECVHLIHHRTLNVWL